MVKQGCQNPFRNDFFYGDRWGGTATHSVMFTNNLALTTSIYAASFDRDWWRQSSNSGQRPNDAADPAYRLMSVRGRTDLTQVVPA